MSIKICCKKDFIEKDLEDLQPAETKCSQNNLLVEQGCKYSHIPMTVRQELLSDTEHAQEQCSEITLKMCGSVHKRHRQDHTPTTTKGWRSALAPHSVSRHIGGSRQGHPRYTEAREARPWVAHDTIHCATNVHNQKDTHHCLSKHTIPENSGTGQRVATQDLGVPRF